MLEPNVFQIPELCGRIARYLSMQDAINCVQVCKEWNTIFINVIWYTIEVDVETNSKLPDQEALAKHFQFIRNLILRNSSLDLIPSSCPNLRSLSIERVSCLQANILRGKQQLIALELKSVELDDASVLWKLVASELHQLRELYLIVADIDQDSIEHFWMVCSRLCTLQLRRVELSRGPDSALDFPQMRSMKIGVLIGLNLEDYRDWFSNCPNLTHLQWAHRTTFPLSTMSVHVVRESWSLLQSLDLHHAIISDKDLAMIVEGMRKVTELFATVAGIGPYTFSALRPHFAGLEALSYPLSHHTRSHLGGDVTCRMINEVLTSCPKLRQLAVGALRPEDLLSKNEQPWVCTSLSVLNFQIGFPRISDPALHHAIFAQLSRLHSLEFLGITGPGNSDAENRQSLDFRLSMGLSQLATLTRLKHILLEDAEQNMELEDLQWLFENLRGLQEVSGRLNMDDNKERELQTTIAMFKTNRYP
ncbi:hypothetical protein BX616_011016 [Lobosporangium transversale]|uniref:F-box domain-containing protein n=1 Tax=Lobosporangium transversale TaxID=64571 RepID=A0A1Y2H4V3_9FUNG|nr:hypothetical protein BCR41DRAFT_344421 [Lobosporangium transversale]KAF9917877.1 hypothetical protein BX616_011016 [Lobosporangium transversale]ORZ29011.1 hypothetical protein BCR41DRAFT_344421 [Lobosporangium transversale]|eukprot:XP_021886684.1 hypothetical protein BCR41DRAFT_344421 [Lobosporangium transversale]